VQAFAEGYLLLWRMARWDPMLRALPGEQFKATIGLICSVNWKPGTWTCPKCQEVIEVPAGGTTKTVRVLADEAFGVPRMTMHRTLTRLGRSRFLVKHQSRKCHTLYLVRNWAKYQDAGTTTGQRRDKVGTKAGHIEKGETGKKGKKDYSPQALGAAGLLLESILAWKEDHKLSRLSAKDQAAWCAKQAPAIDKLLRLDGVDWERVKAVLRWLPSDDFWPANVQSGTKLRAKFDTLEGKMRRPGGQLSLMDDPEEQRLAREAGLD
jgi:hypothetical protein